MVDLAKAVSSNEQIAAAFPQGLVAVFVGGTSGVGQYTLAALAKIAPPNTRVYMVGRSRAAAEKIINECASANCAITFLQGNISELKEVDNVCRQIQAKETAVNLLVQSQGSTDFASFTSEGLYLPLSLALHSRIRFVVNLLPLLQRATCVRRVVSIFAGTTEGPVDFDDFAGQRKSMVDRRDHLASCMTLAFCKIQADAPTVSFVHTNPGVVPTQIHRDAKGMIKVLFGISNFLGPLLFHTPPATSGQMHLFFATSARYAPRKSSTAGAAAAGGPYGGVPLPDGVVVSRGVLGEEGGGVYSLSPVGESLPPKKEELMRRLRDDGAMDRVWSILMTDYKRIAAGKETSV